MDKKLQGSLKSTVKSFGDLVHAWRDHSQSVKQYLSYLLSLIRNRFSIFKTLCPSSPWRPFFVSSGHEDLSYLLDVAVSSEIESTLALLRETSHDLESLSIAMKLKAEEAWATIGEQPLDTFTDSSIFDSSHVLEIVDMTNVFCTESDRIRIAVQKLLVIILDLQLTTIEIDKACSCMQDIDSSNIQFGGEESQFFRRVESFLIQNGIEVTSTTTSR